MRACAKDYNTPHSEIYDPYVNVTIGIKYLAKLTKRFEDAQTAYGETLAGLSTAATSELQGATDWMADIQESHRLLGESFDRRNLVAPSIAEAGGVKLKGVESKAPHYQKPTYGAPTGGWYGESAYAHPAYGRGTKQLSAVSEFQRWLSELSAGNIAPFLPTPEGFGE